MQRRRLSVARLSEVRTKHRPRWGGVRGYYFDDLVMDRGFGYSRKEEIVRKLYPSQFDPDWEYKPWQLELWASVWIHKNPYADAPAVLNESAYADRLRHEVYVASGVADPTITADLSPDGQTMYWRTSPVGRRVNSREQRQKNGASFYR